MTFLVLMALGVLMAVIYVPLRIYLTLTARSRRLRLLQRIGNCVSSWEELAQLRGSRLSGASAWPQAYHAAVHLQHLAGDVGRCWIGCQEAHGAGYLIGLPSAPVEWHWQIIGLEILGHVSGDEAWATAFTVILTASSRAVVRVSDHAGFGGGVIGLAIAHQAHHRGDVDDAAHFA